LSFGGIFRPGDGDTIQLGLCPRRMSHHYDPWEPIRVVNALVTLEPGAPDLPDLSGSELSKEHE
jgi:hypothetical protein